MGYHRQSIRGDPDLRHGRPGLQSMHGATHWHRNIEVGNNKASTNVNISLVFHE